MREGLAEQDTPNESGIARRSGVVCPSLVLAVRIVCDKRESLHEPGRLHVRDYCTTEMYSRCSRWSQEHEN